jgi:ATP-dependent protease ClpP protease subunit
MTEETDFTPNPDRAIWIEGKFTGALLERLRPQILELTAQSREPITVFLNSSGGSPDVGEELLKLLRRTTPDDARASRLITVAMKRASSMGANFLSAGDFAIAHPAAELLWHGGRWPLSDMVSAGEAGRLYVQTLQTFHERNARKLAQASVHRFLLIVSAYRERFAQHRADVGWPALGDVECFQAILRGNLSPVGQEVLARAIPLWHSSNGLLLHFQKKLRRGRSVTSEHLRKLMLYSAFSFEFEKGDPPDWDAGLGRISDHFYFLNSYFDFGVLRDYVAGREPLPAVTGEEDYSLPFRMFFLALCRALQQGENSITPADAVWLGLIDTVRVS